MAQGYRRRANRTLWREGGIAMPTSEVMNREEYRQLCKHYSPYSGQCYKKSIITGVANNVHINMSCDGKCARMSNYDKKNTVVIYGNRRTNN